MFYRNPRRGEIYWIERFNDGTVLGTPPLTANAMTHLVNDLFSIHPDVRYNDSFVRELEPVTREQFERIVLLGR
ncbi:MAG: hypothetical protein HPY50_05850 [Firmicutes bacterium]|nr:hypothetical protein [Bacillota bacterium]